MARRAEEQSRKAWPYVILGGFALLTLVLAIADAVAGSVVTTNTFLAGMWVIFLPLLRWSSLRARDRAQRAEAAAIEVRWRAGNA
jgi:hypothetical protein